MGPLANGKANADVLLNETAALFAAEFGREVSSFQWTSAMPAGRRFPDIIAGWLPRRIS